MKGADLYLIEAPKREVKYNAVSAGKVCRVALIDRVSETSDDADSGSEATSEPTDSDSSVIESSCGPQFARNYASWDLYTDRSLNFWGEYEKERLPRKIGRLSRED